MVDVDEGRHLAINVAGEDRQVGSRVTVAATLDVVLRDDGGSQVQIDGSYEVTGKVASMGTGTIRKKADQGARRVLRPRRGIPLGVGVMLPGFQPGAGRSKPDPRRARADRRGKALPICGGTELLLSMRAGLQRPPRGWWTSSASRGSADRGRRRGTGDRAGCAHARAGSRSIRPSRACPPTARRGRGRVGQRAGPFAGLSRGQPVFRGTLFRRRDVLIALDASVDPAATVAGVRSVARGGLRPGRLLGRPRAGRAAHRHSGAEAGRRRAAYRRFRVSGAPDGRGGGRCRAVLPVRRADRWVAAAFRSGATAAPSSTQPTSTRFAADSTTSRPGRFAAVQAARGRGDRPAGDRGRRHDGVPLGAAPPARELEEAA